MQMKVLKVRYLESKKVLQNKFSFFRYYDVLLCIDHKYARIKKFVSILISQLVKIEIELIYRYTDF